MFFDYLEMPAVARQKAADSQLVMLLHRLELVWRSSAMVLYVLD